MEGLFFADIAKKIRTRIPFANEWGLPLMILHQSCDNLAMGNDESLCVVMTMLSFRFRFSTDTVLMVLHPGFLPKVFPDGKEQVAAGKCFQRIIR